MLLQYPIDNNMVTYIATPYLESLYILAKPAALADYTVCELRSWVTPKCSTSFDLSGTSGGHMKARCEDPDDLNAYGRVSESGTSLAPVPSRDWRNMADEWQLAINLNGAYKTSRARSLRLLVPLDPAGSTVLNIEISTNIFPPQEAPRTTTRPTRWC